MTEKAKEMREQEKKQAAEERKKHLRAQMKMLLNPIQDLKHMDDPLEPIKVVSAYKSKCMVLDYRQKNEPDKISELDYSDIYALWKQIPSKPTGIQQRKSGHRLAKCGECGANINSREQYCKKCGQRIFWGKGDEEC